MVKRQDNSQDAPKTFANRFLKKLLNIPFFILKVFYFLPFLAFALWLLQLLYFPHLEAHKIVEQTVKPAPEEHNVFKAILDQPDLLIRGHFHIIDEYVSQPEPKAPICLTCHGTYPHSKEKKVRSLLNFHTGFIACAVCHARKDSGDKQIDFGWVDRETGKISSKVEGEYGKYPAKIFPVRTEAGGQISILRPVDDKLAQQYLSIKDKYSPDQVARAKIKLHEGISSKPVFCSDCHKPEGYLDFIKLGFPPQRVNHLNSTEVVGMIDKYKTFYLPSQIDFGIERTFNK